MAALPSHPILNILHSPLQICSTQPLTGFQRDGYCSQDAQDQGTHVVCAKMTKEFLDFTRGRGNDLQTPRGAFPGLQPGDRWCLCGVRWAEANKAGVAPPVVREATHLAAMKYLA